MSDFVKLNWEFYMENRTTHHMRLGISAVGYIYGIEIRPSRKSKVHHQKFCGSIDTLASRPKLCFNPHFCHPPKTSLPSFVEWLDVGNW